MREKTTIRGMAPQILCSKHACSNPMEYYHATQSFESGVSECRKNRSPRRRQQHHHHHNHHQDEYLEPHLEMQQKRQQQQHHQRKHVHFKYREADVDDYTNESVEKPTLEYVQSTSSSSRKQRPKSQVPTLPTSSSSISSAPDDDPYNFQVDCNENPTELFTLMNRRLWDKALTHLRQESTEARIWISSHYPNSEECKWKNLPLHLACMYGPEPVPLRFMEALIDAYPKAAECRNAEGNLPIHLACDCMGLNPQYGLSVEGSLITLIKAFPESLNIKDGRGRRPLDILEGKGLRCDRKANRNMQSGRGVSIMTFMKTRMKRDGMLLGLQHSNDSREEESINSHVESNVGPRDGNGTRRQSQQIHKLNNNRDDDGIVLDQHYINDDREEESVIYYAEQNDGLRDGNEAMRRHQRTQPPHSGRDEYITKKSEQIDLRHLEVIDYNEVNPQQSGNDEHYSANKRNHSKLTISPHSHDDCIGMGTQLPSPSTISCSARYYSNPMPVVTPSGEHHHPKAVASTSSNPSWLSQTGGSINTETNDPFHHLAGEFTSLRHAHNSMTELLNNKSRNEIELQDRLVKLEADYSQLQNKYTTLSTDHSGIRAQLDEQTRALEICKHEMKVMRTKDKAISAELSLKLENEEKHDAKMESLKKEMEKERRAKEVVEEKLKQQMVDFAVMEEKHKVALSSNNESDKNNTALKTEYEALQKEKEILQLQMDKNDLKLRDAKLKESALMDQLVDKIHSVDVAKNTSTETERLLKVEQEKNSKLQIELENAMQTTAFAEGNDLGAQNMALREVALKAIQTVGVLQQKIQGLSLSTKKHFDRSQTTAQRGGRVAHTTDNLEKLLNEADSHRLHGDTSKIGCNMNFGESLVLLNPIMHDAKNLQRDNIERTQQLLQQSNSIVSLIEKIPQISPDSFTFESTLQLLEELITTNIHIGDTLNIALETEERCKSRLAKLLNIAVHDEVISLPKQKIVDNNIEILVAAASSARSQSTNMITCTRKHIEKIESLYKKISELQSLKKLNPERDQDVQKRLFLATEIASILQKALSNIVQDTKQLKSMDSIVTCANEELASVETMFA